MFFPLNENLNFSLNVSDYQNKLPKKTHCILNNTCVHVFKYKFYDLNNGTAIKTSIFKQLVALVRPSRGETPRLDVGYSFPHVKN